MAKQRQTKAHKELGDIAMRVVYVDDGDGPDNFIFDLIARLPTKDAKELVDLWRREPEDEE